MTSVIQRFHLPETPMKMKFFSKSKLFSKTSIWILSCGNDNQSHLFLLWNGSCEIWFGSLPPLLLGHHRWRSLIIFWPKLLNTYMICLPMFHIQRKHSGQLKGVLCVLQSWNNFAKAALLMASFKQLQCNGLQLKKVGHIKQSSQHN